MVLVALVRSPAVGCLCRSAPQPNLRLQSASWMHELHDYLCARIRLTNKGNSSVSYDSQVDPGPKWLDESTIDEWLGR